MKNSIFKKGLDMSLDILIGLETIDIDTKKDSNNYPFQENEKALLGIKALDYYKENDTKRYLTGIFPTANYVFKTILESKKSNVKLELNFLGENNPFKEKYNGKELETYIEKFECLRDYINEVSHSVDAPGIGGLAGATDFLQLYKYIMLDEIIEKKYRDSIIEELFKLLNSENIETFIEGYESFINSLVKLNTVGNDKLPKDRRLSRLYNRMYYIFSYVLNSLKPDEFPIYFSRTRGVLKVFGIEGYKNITNTYKNFLKKESKELKILLEKLDFSKYKNFNNSIDEYLELINIEEYKFIENFKYSEIKFNKINKNLFENHAKYMFFQDICYILYESLIDGESFISNIGVGKKFICKEIEEYRKKLGSKNIVDIDYLKNEKYISENSIGEYFILKVEDNFLKNKNMK